MVFPIRSLLLVLAELIATPVVADEELVEVRSSIGVPLGYVEVWDSARLAWKQFVAVDGIVRVPVELDVSSVRAPGHRRQTIKHEAGSWSLEAAASLEVRLEQRACVRSIEPGRSDASGGLIAEEAAYGFVDERTWRIAVAPGRFDQLTVTLKHDDAGTSSTATFWCDTGVHGVWEPECLPEAGTRPVELVLVDPDHPRGRTSIELRGIRSPAPMAYGSPEKHDWGTVTHTWPKGASLASRNVPANVDRIRFDVSAAWEELRAIVRSKETGARADVTFANDTTPREIVLEPGLVVRGGLVDAEGAPVTGPIIVRWGRRRPGEDWPREGVWPHSLELGAEGRFELVGTRLGPGELPRFVHELGREPSVHAGLTPSMPLALAVRAPGFVARIFDLECGDVPTFDCGDLVLEPAEPDLVLLPARSEGEGRSTVIVPPLAEAIQHVLIPDNSAERWPVELARRTERDELELFIGRTPGDLVAGRLLALRSLGHSATELYPSPGYFGWNTTVRPWPDDPASAVLVVGPANAAYARDEDGDLRRVPEAWYDVEVEGKPPGILLRVEWRSMVLEVEREATPESTLRLRFQAPRDDVFLLLDDDRLALQPGEQRIER